MQTLRARRRRAAPNHFAAASAGLSAVLATIAYAPDASASGFATARFGGEHGNPVTDNATSLYYNPAGMAESEGVHIFADGNIALRWASYAHTQAPTDVDEQESGVPSNANYGEATLFNVAAAPMLGATFKISDLALGLAFYVPFGGSSTWDENEDFAGVTEYPGVVDGVQRWGSITGTLRSLYWTLGVAYNFKDIGLSVGAGANLIRSEIKTIRARNTDGSNRVSSEGRSFIDVGDWQGSFSVGALFQAVPDKLWFGASYQARPNIAGGMSLDGDLVTNLRGKISTTKIDVIQDLPDIVRLGAKYRPVSDIELRLFGDWSRWSSLEDQCLVDEGNPCELQADGSPVEGTPVPLLNIRRDWQDAFGIRAGGSYWLSEKTEIFSGLGYDSNAVPSETLDPSLTDFHDISVALGARLQIIEHLAAALSYTHLFYFPRNNAGESILGPCATLPEAERIPGENCLQNPSASPDSGGQYTQTIGVFNVNVDVSF
jgi:long-chain fatty acid transport protein